MKPFLFQEFDTRSAAAWKQKIQVDLKGLDYNETLLWKTEEDIVVKPFYTAADRKALPINMPTSSFAICQSIFVDDEKIANSLAINALKRGANSIQFTANKRFDSAVLLKNIDISTTKIFFKLQFLDEKFVEKLSKITLPTKTFYQIDILGNLAESGNWYDNLKADFRILNAISKTASHAICVDVSLYENAGAGIVQQLAYALSHTNEYLENLAEETVKNIHFIFSVRGNYFFEIAKLRAFRILIKALFEEYNQTDSQIEIFVQPSLRNKTIFDYNVNMLRTTSESMSAILGGATTISNVPYDAVYHKSNEFGERISRNQLLILKEEAGFNEGQFFAEGSYYIESITNQLAEKGLALFQQLEKKGGFLKLLKDGVLQQKITEKARKEHAKFDAQELRLLGTNLHPNASNQMLTDIELYPFVKQRNIKTLLTPINRNRLSEAYEKERLENEKKIASKATNKNS
ncbi:methylmalonyl-CoA mutase subunit beta [Polaribacter sp.]|jgi:methylmalonyl-CoA mutase|nr:methylmalonyl-CoA mutase subunit beta [Polaribacter sp.]